MRHPSRLQISDLEVIPSRLEQEITSEEAIKVLGGDCTTDYFDCLPLEEFTLVLAPHLIPSPKLLGTAFITHTLLASAAIGNKTIFQPLEVK